jgi:hypothetical protein
MLQPFLRPASGFLGSCHIDLVGLLGGIGQNDDPVRKHL